jgi:hypothetical protein
MRKLTSFFVLLTFVISCVMPPQGFAQSLTAVGLMSEPGTAVTLSSVYTPAYLKGMVINPTDPFKFNFIMYRGDEPLEGDLKQAEYSKLIKYFLASLAVPDTEQWVNLSPYEQDRIIPENFGLTEMGRDLLAQDYMLKQISSSLTDPDTDLGKQFWDGVYSQAYEKFGTTDISTDTFNKVWITPDKAVVYEKGNTVYVLEHHLKVMLEKDYLATQENKTGIATPEENETTLISQRVMRDVIIPAIEREVNEGKNFAPVRQVYSGMLLASWYKLALKESILGKLYADQGKVKGVDQDPAANQEIYTQYVEAFKKGVFNMIREDMDMYTQEVIPRKYFSGGMNKNTYLGNKAEGIAPILRRQNGNVSPDLVVEKKISDEIQRSQGDQNDFDMAEAVVQNAQPYMARPQPAQGITERRASLNAQNFQSAPVRILQGERIYVMDQRGAIIDKVFFNKEGKLFSSMLGQEIEAENPLSNGNRNVTYKLDGNGGLSVVLNTAEDKKYQAIDVRIISLEGNSQVEQSEKPVAVEAGVQTFRTDRQIPETVKTQVIADRRTVADPRTVTDRLTAPKAVASTRVERIIPVVDGEAPSFDRNLNQNVDVLVEGKIVGQVAVRDGQVVVSQESKLTVEQNGDRWKLDLGNMKGQKVSLRVLEKRSVDQAQASDAAQNIQSKRAASLVGYLDRFLSLVKVRSKVAAPKLTTNEIASRAEIGGGLILSARAMDTESFKGKDALVLQLYAQANNQFAGLPAATEVEIPIGLRSGSQAVEKGTVLEYRQEIASKFTDALIASTADQLRTAKETAVSDMAWIQEKIVLHKEALKVLAPFKDRVMVERKQSIGADLQRLEQAAEREDAKNADKTLDVVIKAVDGAVRNTLDLKAKQSLVGNYLEYAKDIIVGQKQLSEKGTKDLLDQNKKYTLIKNVLDALPLNEINETPSNIPAAAVERLNAPGSKFKVQKDGAYNVLTLSGDVVKAADNKGEDVFEVFEAVNPDSSILKENWIREKVAQQAGVAPDKVLIIHSKYNNNLADYDVKAFISDKAQDNAKLTNKLLGSAVNSFNRQVLYALGRPAERRSDQVEYIARMVEHFNKVNLIKVDGPVSRDLARLSSQLADFLIATANDEPGIPEKIALHERALDVTAPFKEEAFISEKRKPVVADLKKYREAFEQQKRQQVPVDSAQLKGGIDMNSAALDMQIKRDGAGVPLPVSQQDIENIRIDGLVPVILNIQPAANMPLFS